MAHRWWLMMVGVNETWYGVVDAGLTRYMGRLSRAARGRRPASLDSLDQSYGRTAGDEREGALMWNANHGGPDYGFRAYGKAPLMRSMLGGGAMQRAMGE